MIRNLVKHELIRTRGVAATVFGVDALLAALGFVMALTRLPVIAGLGQVLVVAAAGALVPVLLLCLAVEHWRSSFTGRGYLTHAIPVRGATQLWVKVGMANLWGLLALLLSCWWALVASLAMARVQGRPMSEVFDGLRATWRSLLDAPVSAVLVGLALILFTLLGYVAMLWFAVAVGSERRMSGTSWGPVVVYVALYVIVQTVTMAAIMLVPFGMEMAGENLFHVHSINVMEMMGTNSTVLPLGFLPVLVLLPIPLLWRARQSWEHRVSLP